jgi:hypothetical protein
VKRFPLLGPRVSLRPALSKSRLPCHVNSYSKIAIAILCVAYSLLMLPHVPSLTPDSQSYIAFAPMRTAGYPLFLNLFGIRAAVALQPVLYSLALFFLACELLRSLTAGARHVVIVFLILLTCMGNPELNKYHAMVMTESLSMTALIWFLCVIVFFLRTASISAAVMASVVVGLASAIRPSAYALLVTLPIMVLFRWKALAGRRSVMLAAVLCPALSLIAIERSATSAYHGAAATSLAGRHFFAKAGMIEAPEAAASDDAPTQLLNATLQSRYAPIRALLDVVPRWDVRDALSESYEGCLEYSCIEDVRDSLHLPEAEMNRLALRVGLARIRRSPMAYASLVWERYRSLWTLYKLRYPDAASVFNAFIEAHRPLPFQDRLLDVSEIATPSTIGRFVRPLGLGLGFLTCGLAIIGLAAGARLQALDGRLAAASLASLTVHGTFLVTAATGLGILRYTISMWPAMMTALALGVGWLADVSMVRARKNG